MPSQSPVADQDAQRRKVRKGTHSCWECRRRKIRCQFSSQNDAVCIGCRARGSACRSQEFADEAPAPAPERKVTQRLDRLEAMMERLMEHVLDGPRNGGSASASASASVGGVGGSSTESQRERRSTSLASSNTEEAPVPVPAAEVAAPLQSSQDNNDHPSITSFFFDPATAVAAACPRALAQVGIETRDVLDMSTADETPVAALLGIQESLSNVSPPANLSAGTQDAGMARGAGFGPNATNSGTSPSSTGGHTASTEGGSYGTAATSVVDPGVSISALSASEKHHGLSRVLHAQFPCQADINTIVGGSHAEYVISLFHSAHDIAEGRSESPSSLAVVPPVTSHPTVLARRLLQLTLCMQQMAPCFTMQNKLRMTETLPALINRISILVTLTVTASDDLVGNLEGLQCQILMGQQQSNAGHLRKAWLSYRRALNLAQLMGLDRGNTRALKSCDPKSDPRTRPTPASLWYRINACDRYVSLLLGLRAGVQDGGSCGSAGVVTIPSSFVGDDTNTPVERLSKVHTVLEGRIIERNYGSVEDAYAITQAIDGDLQAAAMRDIDPAWWQLPTYDAYASPSVIFQAMQRAVLQVHHHCILILLHLPYMLRGDHPAATAAMVAESQQHQHGGSTIDYSKAVCMRSSRAVLLRFINFRKQVISAFSCRHVDYASLIAAMTLVIGYLGPRPGADAGAAVQDAFDDQLHRDRAMVEEVRNRMRQIGKANDDKLATESAATIQQLLPILDLVGRSDGVAAATATAASASAATAATATATTMQSSPVALGSGALGMSGVEDANMDAVGGMACPSLYPSTSPSAAAAVRLNVPYFGTVNIHPNAATAASPHMHSQPPQPQVPAPCCPTTASSFGLLSPQPGDGGGGGGGGAWPMTTTPAHQDSTTADLNAMLVDFDTMPTDDNAGFPGFAAAAAFPDMTAASDDWVMQGIDTTYWSLLNGGMGG